MRRPPAIAVSEPDVDDSAGTANARSHTVTVSNCVRSVVSQRARAAHGVRWAAKADGLPLPAVRFIRPDLALIHWSWTIQGDKNADGSMRPQRFGLMTMLAEKHNGSWLVAAAQNTNAGSAGGSPEAQDIKSPIGVARPESRP